MTLAAIIAALLIGPTCAALGWLAKHERSYRLGYDDGYDMGHADGYGQAETEHRQHEHDVDDLRAEIYDLEQRLAACAAAVHPLPGGAR